MSKKTVAEQKAGQAFHAIEDKAAGFAPGAETVAQNIEPARESAAVQEVLSHQSLDSQLLPGWKRPTGDRLPVPTFAPAVMAFGIVLFAMGLATVWYVCAVGALVFAVAAWRWTGELQGE